MRNCLVFAFMLALLTSCSQQRYFIVRHAEKAPTGNGSSMSATNPPLSDEGKQRAEDLKNELVTEKIGYIFSTNTLRTKETAEPTRAYFGLTTETYPPMPDDAFISKLKTLNKNTLIVGHSNTIDDVVNRLSGRNLLSDLPETEYNHLFILIKKGNKWKFRSLTYGK